MIDIAATDHERNEAGLVHATLVRLANSCEREAGRRKGVAPDGSDLDEDDLRTIAGILRTFATTTTGEAS